MCGGIGDGTIDIETNDSTFQRFKQEESAPVNNKQWSFNTNVRVHNHNNRNEHIVMAARQYYVHHSSKTCGDTTAWLPRVVSN
jgi:hypothetical protein